MMVGAAHMLLSEAISKGKLTPQRIMRMFEIC